MVGEFRDEDIDDGDEGGHGDGGDAAAADDDDGCDVGDDHIFTHQVQKQSQTVTKVTLESFGCPATKN